MVLVLINSKTIFLQNLLVSYFILCLCTNNNSIENIICKVIILHFNYGMILEMNFNENKQFAIRSIIKTLKKGSRMST